MGILKFILFVLVFVFLPAVLFGIGAFGVAHELSTVGNVFRVLAWFMSGIFLVMFGVLILVERRL